MALLLNAALEILTKTLTEGDQAGYKAKWLAQSDQDHLKHASGHWDMFAKTMSEEELRHHAVRLLMWWVQHHPK